MAGGLAESGGCIDNTAAGGADYQGAPGGRLGVDRAAVSATCPTRRPFDSEATYVSSSARFKYDYDVPYSANGFRPVRELPK